MLWRISPAQTVFLCVSISLAAPAIAQRASEWQQLDESPACPIGNRIRVVDWSAVSDMSALQGCRSQIVEGRARKVRAAPDPVRIQAPLERPVPRNPLVHDAAAFGSGQSLINRTARANFPTIASGRIDTFVNAAAARYNIDANLLHAVIGVESGYRAKAVSPAGARGLMQVMPATARSLGVAPADLWDARTNIDTGARLLYRLNARYAGDLPTVLAAYNAGPGAVDRYGGEIPPYPETINYVEKVTERYHALVVQ